MYFCSVFVKIWFCKILRKFIHTLYIAVPTGAFRLFLFVRLSSKALQNVNTRVCTVRLALQCEKQTDRGVPFNDAVTRQDYMMSVLDK